MLKIHPLDVRRSIECKRANLPFLVVSKCPKCGEEITHDYSRGEYVSGPVVNGKNTLYFYHDTPSGEHEWQVTVMLRMTMEEVRS